MATSRTLGRGRVFGTLKPPPPSVSEHVIQTGLLSPPESTLSPASEVSTLKSSNDDDGISTAAALQAKGNMAAASAMSRLVCPICNEEMVTLLQLNRHIDDDHGNLEDIEQDEVKTWFKTRMIKAKKFQPLAVLNQKLKGLDVFESNEEQKTSSHVRSGTSTPEPTKLESVKFDPDDIVTRQHWQRYTRNGTCSDPLCEKRLGNSNGNINCRKCGKLFCEEHTMYQMKLSRSAMHEPVRGFWCRVCETCYKSRDGYNDHSGTERDLMAEVAGFRRKALDRSYLQVSRLEKRLTKLTKVLSDPALQQEQSAVGFWWSFTGAKTSQRALEQSVVDWEDDVAVPQCPFCQQEFSNYSFRRHHCRLCGRVVCADATTGCSEDVGLNVIPQANELSEKGTGQVIEVSVRMCKDCKHRLFSKSDFAAQLAVVTPDQRAFHNLKQFENGIRMILPRFQKLLAALQDVDQTPTSTQITEASRVRRRLLDSFTQYDVAARRIRDMPTTSPTQLMLQKQVYTQASHFLHLHMLPLKSLPKMLKHASPSSLSNASSANSGNGHSTHNLTSLAKIRTSHSPSPSQDTTTSTAISSLEAEEKSLREQLIVLEEQKFFLGQMLADANKRRKFEEAESLSKNIEEIGKEIDRVQGTLGGLDFASAYADAHMATGTVQTRP